MNTLPFQAKMETSQFMHMAQSFRDKGQTLEKCYENSETVHQAFLGQSKYPNFETFKKEYYTRHASKR